MKRPAATETVADVKLRDGGSCNSSLEIHVMHRMKCLYCAHQDKECMLPRSFRLSWMTKSHGAGIRRCHKLSVLFHVYQIRMNFPRSPLCNLSKCVYVMQMFDLAAMIPISSHKKLYPLMMLRSHHFQDCLG